MCACKHICVVRQGWKDSSNLGVSSLLHDLNGVSKAVALLVPKPLFDRYPEISGVVASINKGMAVVAGQGA